MSYVADGGVNAVDVTISSEVTETRFVPDYGINYADISVEGTSGFVIGAISRPDKVNINQQFTITVTVVNSGGQSGDVTVRLYENESLVATQTVTIDPGASKDVSFTRTAPSSPTTLNYKIELYNNTTGYIDDQASFTVQVIAPSTGGTNYTAIIGLIIIVILLLLLFIKRK